MRISFRALYDHVNDIVVRHGVQKGQKLLRQALEAKGKVQGFAAEAPRFPLELMRHEMWIDDLHVGDAEDVLLYAERASTLAYRYLRVARKGGKKKRNS